jgi:phosphatidylglycerol lysyltransferase
MQLKPQSSLPHQSIICRLVVLGVAINGIILIAGTLFDELVTRSRLHEFIHLHANETTLGISLIGGLTLLYLSSLLIRRKQAAWIIAVIVYALILGYYSVDLFILHHMRHMDLFRLLRYFVLPAIILIGLIYCRLEFRVRSDIQNFQQSLRFIILILVIAFIYGVGGFMLMDQADFHQEISFGNAVHRTIDQFGLTTNTSLTPYTHRAKLFMDSLSIISIGAVSYALISLFQPLRARFIDQNRNREIMSRLLIDYPATSEDFFKLWPHDKMYFLNDNHSSALALRVHRGIALVVSDPAGNSQTFDVLLANFIQLCHYNDWTPAFIHTEDKYQALYEKYGFHLQKIGEEAVVNIEHFQSSVVHNKYFRNIYNKFTKQGFTAAYIKPPYPRQTLAQLGKITKEWGSQAGRVERGFMMGYYSEYYIQRCPLMVIFDQANNLKAFMNQIPSFDKLEANFDLLQHSNDSLGNINDFLLLNFIKTMGEQGFKRVNLGLSPLTGIDKDENKSLIDSTLRFAYSNGDRFYSFSGLHRFKAKYEPVWDGRYIVYPGGIRNFTRTLTALNHVMKVPKTKRLL